MTPLLGFSTPPQIPNNITSERLPITTIMFAATTPKNTPFAYHASTLTNPSPTISPAFVEANYEILESLLRERRRPEPRMEATPTLRLRSPRVRRQRERVVGFEDAPNNEGNRRGRNVEGIRPSEIEAREGENRGANLPPPLAAPRPSIGKEKENKKKKKKKERKLVNLMFIVWKERGRSKIKNSQPL
ncbi:hypothetical protein Tco_0956577 [Tanacetum coccineum]